MDLLILVTLGTQDKPFIRLIKAVEKQVELGNIKEEVVVQAGCTKYKSNLIEVFDYISIDEFNNYIDKANIIITHAGVGTIINGLKKGKKLIVAARLKKYKEHVNDHQLQILENFSQDGYILPLEDFYKLNDVIELSKEFVPREFVSNNDSFIANLIKEIDE